MMKEDRSTEGGTQKSLDSGSRSSVNGIGSRRLRLMTPDWDGGDLRRGRVLGGVMEIVPRGSGLTRVGLILRGFVFVSGTIEADGTFTPSSVEFPTNPDVMLGRSGSTSTGLRAWMEFAARRRSATSQSTD